MSGPASRLLPPALYFIVGTVAVMQTVVVPIIGTIRAQLDIGVTAVGWVLTANLLAAAVATPLLGRLADLRGKKTVLIGILSAVLVGSLLCALTDSFALLVAGRILQGVSFALFPVGIAVLRDELPPQKLIGAMGLISGTMGVGGAIGMVLTGVLVDGDTDYRRVFWFVVACNIVGLLLAITVVPRRPRISKGRIDWAGAFLLAVGLALVLLAVSEGGSWGWSSPGTVLSAICGLVLLVLWFVFERRVDEPLVPPAMLTDRPVLVLHLIALVVGMCMFVNFLATASFVQTPVAAGYGFGATVLEATAVYMLPGALVGVVAAALAGRMIHRFGARHTMGASCLFGIAGFALFAALHTRPWQIVTAGILISVFVSLAYAALPTLLVAEVPPEATGVANSINSIARSVGSSLSSAAVAALLATMVGDAGFPQEAAYTVVFAAGAVAAVVAAVLVYAVVRAPRPQPTIVEVDPARNDAGSPSPAGTAGCPR